MKAYKILLREDWSSDFEIVLTNIPFEKLEHYLFMYVNFSDLGIDFDEVLKKSGYKFKVLCNCIVDIDRYGFEGYPIKQSYSIDKFYYDV